jgi:CHASE2 domain-containing sensor protein
MLTNLRNLLTQPVFVISLITGMLVVGVQRLGVLEPVELKAFDQMTQKAYSSRPDPRLLIVDLTETIFKN